MKTGVERVRLSALVFQEAAFHVGRASRGRAMGRLDATLVVFLHRCLRQRLRLNALLDVVGGVRVGRGRGGVNGSGRDRRTAIMPFGLGTQMRTLYCRQATRRSSSLSLLVSLHPVLGEDISFSGSEASLCLLLSGNLGLLASLKLVELINGEKNRRTESSGPGDNQLRLLRFLGAGILENVSDSTSGLTPQQNRQNCQQGRRTEEKKGKIAKDSTQASASCKSSSDACDQRED